MEESKSSENPSAPPLAEQDEVEAVFGRQSEHRLMIRKMELENFKSYAGVQQIGPFHKSFSAIVGPNGSGKSNVIDALLFVFGKRASKIRLKKISELIHNSAQHPNLKACRVSVYFHLIRDISDEGYETLEGSEFCITRTADHKSKSQYFIDDKPSSFTGVQKLLSRHGVDLENNRFLILQGEVEQIAMMKPKAQTPHETGLLEYLEDIIGTQKFVEPIAVASDKVESLGEQRQEKLNRLRIVEKEVAALQQPRDEAAAYFQKETELLDHKAVLLQCLALEHQVAAQKIAAVSEGHRKELEALEGQNAGLKKEVADLKKQLKTAQAEYNATKQVCADTKSQFASFERRDIEHKETMKHTKAKRKTIRATIKRLETQREALEKKIQTEQAELGPLQKRLAALEREREKEQAELDRLFEEVREATEPIQVKLEARQKELVPLQQAVNIHTQKKETLIAELNFHKKKVEKAEKALDRVRKALQSAKEKFKTLTKEAGARTAELAESEQSLAELKKNFEQQSEELQRVNQERQRVLARYEAAVQELQTNQSRGRIVEQLLKLKRRGKLPGVEGKLGDLGTIDPKYDVAVSTAVPRLSNIVVNTSATGRRCVEILRAHKLGRATFILLDRIAHLERRMYLPAGQETPENVPRLFDLVRPKHAKYLPAFFQAMGNTLVAEDLEQAIRIANHRGQRWRVVTLKGEVVDASGTMSGGGQRIMSGGMRLRAAAAAEAEANREQDGGEEEKGVSSGEVTEAQLQELKQAAAQLEQQRQSLRQARQASQTEIQRLETLVRSLRLEVRKLEQALKASRLEVSELQAQEDPLQRVWAESGDLFAREEVRLGKEITAETEAERQAQTKTVKLETQIRSLEEEILNAGGAELRKQKTKVELLAESQSVAGTRLNEIRVGEEAARKRIRTSEEDQRQAEAELAALEEELQKQETEFQNIELQAMEVMNALTEAEAELGQRAEELRKIQAASAAREKELETRAVNVLEVTNRLEDNQREAEEVKKRLRQCEKNLEDMWRRIKKNKELFADVLLDKTKEKTTKKHQKNQETEVTKKDGQTEAGEGARDDEMKNDEDNSSRSDGDDDDDDGDDDGREEDPDLRRKTPEELEKVDRGSLEARINLLERELMSLKPNLKALREYKAKAVEFEARRELVARATEERDAARREYEGLRRQRLELFMRGFQLITLKLKEMYQMLTLGGDAELDLVDSLDPFAEGIVFQVRPPKKSWKYISNLSGGEKTLSSLALVFALHHFKPTPIYVMDEIDAALDFKNVSIVGNYIKQRTQRNAQFVIISLRNNMFELANRLVGIYKTNNQTKSLSIDPHRFVVPSRALSGAAGGGMTRRNSRKDSEHSNQTTGDDEGAAAGKKGRLLAMSAQDENETPNLQ